MDDPKTADRFRQAPSAPTPMQNSAAGGTLGAPIAHFDEGFSSDGAFLSGAETEKEATPTESEGSKTPMYELPRAERSPFRVKTTLSRDDDEPIVDSGLDHVVYSHSEEDLLKSIVSAPKETDEARTSLLLQQESFDTDFDECSQSESYKTATSNQFVTSTTALSSSSYVKQPNTISCTDLDSNENQLRKEFEIQAISRPRCTTPVRSCVIEDFIASSQQDDLYERQKFDSEKLKISLPGAPGSVEEQQGRPSKITGGGRRSSKSWSEFYENMAVSSMSGRVSGRTTPLSGELGDPGDMFDKNPAYQYKVPPSPVVHRRSSTDWVNFDAQDHEGYADDSLLNGDGNKINVNDRFTQSQPQPVTRWGEDESNIPAVAAAVSASIAAMSYDEYYDKSIAQHPPSSEEMKTTIEGENENYQSYNQKTTVEGQNENNQSYNQFDSSWTEVPEVEQYPYSSTSEEFSYQNQPVTSLENDTVKTTPHAYVAETGYSEYPSYNSYLVSNEDNKYAAGLDSSYTGELESYPEAPSNFPEAPTNYTDYSTQQVSDYYTEPYEQSFTNYPMSWDIDASVNPLEEGVPSTYDTPWTDNVSVNQNDISSATYEPASVYTDHLSSWDDTPQTVSSVNGSTGKSYQEPSYTTQTTAIESAWDEDESEVPPPSYSRKPPWAYQDYPQEAPSPAVAAAQDYPQDAPPRPPPPPPPAAAAAAEAAPTTRPPIPFSFIKEKEKEPEEPPSKEWLEYQKMTEKISAAMKQTQEKLQEINKVSIAKDLPTRPYEIRSNNPVKQSPPENIMDMDIIPEPTPAVSETDSKTEWKPIHERLNEEIKKQKELNKPKRPPPPKGAPARPPPPPSKAKPTYPTSWDDEEVPPPPPLSKPYDYNAAWDDDSISSTTSYPPAPVNTTVVSNNMTYVEDSSLAQTTNKNRNIDDLGLDALSAMEDSISSVLLPPPPLDIYQTQSISPVSGVDDELPPPPPPPPQEITVGDEDIFNVSKYTSSTIDASKPSPSPAAELDDFFGGGKQTTMAATDVVRSEYENEFSPTSSMIKSPVPPPKSPLVESYPKQQQTTKWEDTTFDTALPSSDSGFFNKVNVSQKGAANNDPFAPQSKQAKVDLFGSLNEEESVMQESYDPFDVKPIDVIVAEAKSKTHAIASAQEAQDDLDFFGQVNHKDQQDDDSSIPHPPSPPLGFGDDFLPDERDEENRTPSPLFDEDDSQPLKEYPERYTGDGWEVMLRYPAKKKIMGERYWKAVFVKLCGNTIQLFYSRNDKRPFQELPLQSNYCMSDITLQQYDIYGKIHTVKVQYVLYKERVGVRPGQIPKLVEGKFTKLGLPLEHAAQTTVLLKFGSLNHNDMQSFVNCVEDVLFKIPSARERPCLYKQDEIQVHCYDEYSAYVNKDGAVSDQRARVRLFCLAFVSGMPYVEIGLNDRRRQGKEVVRRKDIMPMYTERWIRFEALDFHSSVEKPAYDKEHVIKMRPLDATFFEVLRFRVRPPRGKELPLQVRAIMKLAGSKVEIRLEVLVAMFKSRKARQVPCEDIQIRFPIPEAWIYLFREERHWGYGSVHAKIRRPGKVKNIKDRLMGMVQHMDVSLIEAAIGDAKYEHVYRALVWRIPKLPEKHHGAYKTHLLRCRFELNSFDLMPESFTPNCEVEYTMPVATVSHTVVRSVSLEQNDDPDKVEKWVRYLAKYQYKVEVDYVQTTDLDIDAILDTTVLDPEKSLEKTPVLHKPSLDMDVAKEAHGGYRIEFAPGEFGDEHEEKKKNDSSSDSDDERGSHKPPLININMKGYGY